MGFDAHEGKPPAAGEESRAPDLATAVAARPLLLLQVVLDEAEIVLDQAEIVLDQAEIVLDQVHQELSAGASLQEREQTKMELCTMLCGRVCYVCDS